jgi:hypothetical protein
LATTITSGANNMTDKYSDSSRKSWCWRITGPYCWRYPACCR